MKAMVFEAFGETPTILNVPTPSPSCDGVVIEVMATGICRSDWHGWRGHDPDIRLPHVPGHEFAGVIAAIGNDVHRFSVGDCVTMPFIGACGRCGQCRSGSQQVCDDQFQPGFTQWGSFAQYVAINRADINLVPMPEEMDFATASSLGCRFATAFHAVVDQARVRGGEWVAVYGAGGVGLSAIMIAAAVGANVIAIDICHQKLELARAMGAAAIVNARLTSAPVEAVREISESGVHVSIDALGAPETCFNSISSLRRRGRHVQIGLIGGASNETTVPMSQIIASELQVIGSHGMSAWRYDDMLSMIRTGRVRPDRLVRQSLSLSAAIPVLTAFDQHPPDGIAIIEPGR